MNGAETLVRTLLDSGVDTCFTNPGTSEMHFVAALDRIEGMHCVLGLFEGVVTAAADGYARMAERPAATLLHLGPGLGNGLANLHNANKARTPIVNVVGDHAVHHLRHDAPLTSDIEGIARPVSAWVKTTANARTVAGDGAEAVAAAAAHPGQIATLILPADAAWSEAGEPAPALTPTAPAEVDATTIRAVADVLRSGEPTAVYMTGHVLRARGLAAADRVGQASGARLMGQVANARLERGAGRVCLERLPYPVDQALAMLDGVRHVVLVGTQPPVAFFAYPDKPSLLAPEGCRYHTLAEPHEDAVHALEWLVDELGAGGLAPRLQEEDRPAVPNDGAMTVENLSSCIGAMLPENAIVSDEAVTSGRGLHPYTRGAGPHDWLQICGGAIGIGLPLATGAALACPDRKVVALEADGSGMYTLQALWTQAREGLDITTIIYANRRYAILEHEFANVGAQAPGERARDMLEIGRPDLDWVSLARGMGVEAGRATTLGEFQRELGRGLATPGPYLIEAVL